MVLSMRTRCTTALILVASLSSACSKKDADRTRTEPPASPPPPTSSTEPGTPAQPSTPGAPGGAAFSVPRLSITGGPQAGSYTVTADRPACSFGLVGKDTWGIQYTAEGESQPRSIQAMIFGVPRGGGETSELTFTVAFARPLHVQTREGMPNSGSGTISVKGGDTPIITVSVTTKDGESIDAEIHCLRMVGS
jgi:hypothetical protein